ncbi:dCTP deaminase [Candidatus Micrarchaeota archaeon]|nr:dCTP deaminase [Candidatus Micrarchaeota archaeon]
MVLSNRDIKKYIKEGKIKVKPLKKDQIGGSSIDLTLSDTWYFFKEKYIAKQVDLRKVGFRDAVVKRKIDKVILNPGEMCMGLTKEKITLPPNVMGRLDGRSRYARMGLTVHVTSSLVQPGSDNRQVLEIVNLAPFSIVLYSGMRVSQITLYELKSPTDKPYSKYGKIARKQ